MSEQQYQVLARKYRPQFFGELVGQDVLVQTLKNEIEQNKIHHAFVLTGIRGIGKTTTSRIIAKSLNCEGFPNPTITPCLQCSHCASIANSADPDVIEFDAASHTGVDDVRRIIDNIEYAPINSRYKIYIIDEVHMLSKSAFNALLKTLEEPPAYVKFIFATTEIKKVPITILSRCQRFDLRRLTFDEIKTYIKGICEKENYDIEDGALNLISSASEGSVRDSLSLLDRALSFNNYEKLLTEKSIGDMLGLSNKKDVYNLFNFLLDGNSVKALEQFENLYNYNVDVSTLLRELLDVNYNIILSKILTNFFEVTKLPSDQVEIIKNTSQKLQISSLMRVWKMLLKGEYELKSDFDSKKIMEILLLNICYGSRLPSLNDIINGESKEDNNEKVFSEIMDMFEGSKQV